jgi:hypothetical protein
MLFAGIFGISRFKVLDTASKMLAIMTCCAFVNEGAAYFAAHIFHNNLPIYAIYCFVEFSLLCLYFNNIIDVFAKNNIGIYIATGGVMLGIANLIFLQGINNLNSYFLFFEGLSVIAMSFFAFFRMFLKNDTRDFLKYPHFWFLSILIFFWTITFLNWGLYDYVNNRWHQVASMINFVFLIIAAITYGGFGFVFLIYPKLKNDNE